MHSRSDQIEGYPLSGVPPAGKSSHQEVQTILCKLDDIAFKVGLALNFSIVMLQREDSFLPVFTISHHLKVSSIIIS